MGGSVAGAIKSKVFAHSPMKRKQTRAVAGNAAALKLVDSRRRWLLDRHKKGNIVTCTRESRENERGNALGESKGIRLRLGVTESKQAREESRAEMECMRLVSATRETLLKGPWAAQLCWCSRLCRRYTAPSSLCFCCCCFCPEHYQSPRVVSSCFYASLAGGCCCFSTPLASLFHIHISMMIGAGPQFVRSFSLSSSCSGIFSCFSYIDARWVGWGGKKGEKIKGTALRRHELRSSVTSSHRLV